MFPCWILARNDTGDEILYRLNCVMFERNTKEKTFTWDDPVILLSVVAGLYVCVWAAWSFAHIELAMIYTYIRYIQFWVLHALGSTVSWLGLDVVHLWILKMCRPDGLLSPCHRDFSTITWDNISSSSLVVNLFCLLLMVVMCVRMFLDAKTHHPKLNFSKIHNIESFIKENKTLYPHLRLFSEIDLVAMPLDHPVFGMSMTSRQFVDHHRLIDGWQDEANGDLTPVLDRKKTVRILRTQLGKHWTKSTELSPGETLLMAIAIPRVVATDSSLDDVSFKTAMKESEDLIQWCWAQFVPPSSEKQNDYQNSLAWLKPDINLDHPRSLILKYVGHPTVQHLIKRHAYNRTILFACFVQARSLGVLQPAEMRWLRFFDRELWYVLENIGRRAVFAEGAAVSSHYLYELRSSRALVEPQLDQAIHALDVAVRSFKFTHADRQKYEQKETAAYPMT